jgi:hypothetical protein
MLLSRIASATDARNAFSCADEASSLAGIGAPVAQTTQPTSNSGYEDTAVRHIVEIHGRVRMFVV